MSTKPIKMWPPGGGDPIYVLPQYVELMTRRGWCEFDPVRVQKARRSLKSTPEEKKHGDS